MTTVVLDLVQDDVRKPVPAVLVLAAQEGRRMALHPLVLVGVLVSIGYAVRIADNGPTDAFEIVASMITFLVGVPAFFAANLIASRDRRAGSTELLASAPVPAQVRTWALCLGAAVPAGLALALVAVAHAAFQQLGYYEAVPSAWHVVTGPVTVLGGALLGVMVARWLPVPGAAALVMIAMFAYNIALSNGAERNRPLGTFVTWARWTDDPVWAGYFAGSPSWHVAYLLGLCAMAVTGALLPGARRRWLVLLAGAGLTAVTAVLGSVQLT